jgi:hypothetical protein
VLIATVGAVVYDLPVVEKAVSDGLIADPSIPPPISTVAATNENPG